MRSDRAVAAKSTHHRLALVAPDVPTRRPTITSEWPETFTRLDGVTRDQSMTQRDCFWRKDLLAVDATAVHLNDRPPRQILERREMAARGIHRLVGLFKWERPESSRGNHRVRLRDATSIEPTHTRIGLTHSSGT